MQRKQKSIIAPEPAAIAPRDTAALIARAFPEPVSAAIVLGTGFQTLASACQVHHSFRYAELPGFPLPGVLGHGGELLLGSISGKRVIVLSGRAHFYEGYSLAQVTFPVRVLAALGVPNILFTNAAGAINRVFRAGDLMLVEDHLNFIGDNPLRGLLLPPAQRFVDLTQAYDPALRKLLIAAAAETRIRLRRGVYLAVSGPNYETPAEIRAFRRLGADAVGMSTVPEVIVARQCGLKVAAISCLTNLAAGVATTPLSHQEVLATGAASSDRAALLITAFLRALR